MIEQWEEDRHEVERGIKALEEIAHNIEEAV
jgi:hypothetical protein